MKALQTESAPRVDPPGDCAPVIDPVAEARFTFALGVLATLAVALVLLAWIGRVARPAEFQIAAHRIDVNHAGLPELTLLPGVGAAVGRNIVEARAKGGPFKSVEDLTRRVHGVGPKLNERLKPHVRFE